MNRQELKTWAKEKVNGKRWTILPALIVASLLIGLGWPIKHSIGNGIETSTSIPVGSIIFYFVQVGFTLFMINFITDKEYKFEQIFSTRNDFVKYLSFGFIKNVFIFLWSLLLIIPGIIKSIAYALSDFILLDDKYKDLEYTQVLKKSEEMMNGHKADYFMLGLSFIGWHILAVFTLFILELWITPYQEAATTKFLYDVKADYEAKNSPKKTTKKATKKEAK